MTSCWLWDHLAMWIFCHLLLNPGVIERHPHGVYIPDIAYSEHTLNESSPAGSSFFHFHMNWWPVWIEMGHYQDCREGCLPIVVAGVWHKLLMLKEECCIVQTKWSLRLWSCSLCFSASPGHVEACLQFLMSCQETYNLVYWKLKMTWRRNVLIFV